MIMYEYGGIYELVYCKRVSSTGPPAGSVLPRPSIDMPRVRRFSVLCCVLCLSAGVWIELVSADCTYNNVKYGEGYEVTTTEPCLNCTCNRGTLICYLRVCPQLPNPPPIGCILLHRYKTCCTELICEENSFIRNGIEARSDSDNFDVYEKSFLGDACMVNGSIYAPGSAMDSSSFCEYCYCLGGRQKCVKPKCLLGIEGCTPMYDSNNCCPVHYNCTDVSTSTTTTTIPPQNLEGGCLVAGTYYPKGQKLLGVGHSACDNCYCIKGLVTCEPLSCAPHLLGCLPVVKPGECCAASYNCSGTIETRPEPNYGNFPIVSKEYAKLRKEVQKIPPLAKHVLSKLPYYVIAETPNATTTKSHRSQFGTTRHFTGNLNDSTPKPLSRNSMRDDVKPSTGYPEIIYKTKLDATKRNKIAPGTFHATANYEFRHTNYRRPISTTNSPAHDLSERNDEVSSLQKRENLVDYLLETRLTRRFDDKTKDSSSNQTDTTVVFETTATDYVTESLPTTELDPANSTEDNRAYASTILDFLKDEFFNDGINETIFERDINGLFYDDGTSTTTEFPGSTVATSTDEGSNVITMRTVINSTDCTESNVSNVVTHAKIHDVTVVDLESKVKVSTVTVHPMHILPTDIFTITKEKDGYYDYESGPTLPPSLPDIEIIPFLPSDAVDTKLSKKDDPYRDDEVTEGAIYPFTKYFSPPVKTEGGFVPKEPPIWPSNDQIDVVTSKVSSITETNAEEHGCLWEGRKVHHGDSLTSENICVVCVCELGNIVCPEPKCPPVGTGCRESNVLDRKTCCPHLICADEKDSPTKVLDLEVVTLSEDIQPPDLFGSVIQTQPAPNLTTLIIDKPLFVRVPSTTHPETIHNEIITTSTAYTQESSSSISKTENETQSNAPGVGALKLAGCNVYGRMYRVGKIIIELATKCKECKCAETGVQCKFLC